MKTLAFTFVTFLFATQVFGQIDTTVVNGWHVVGHGGSATKAYSAIVDTPTVMPPTLGSTKSQKFYVEGQSGSWVEWEKTYSQTYTMLSDFYIRTYASASNGNYGNMLLAPTFANDTDYFPSLILVVYLWDHYWRPWNLPVNSQYHGRTFKKIRIRFTLEFVNRGALFLDNIGVSNGTPDPNPLIDEMGEDSLVSVADEDKTPEVFHLSQNFPNPFNPRTSIKYSVSGMQYVNLTVYDVLGKEVAVLVDGEMPTGEHSVTFTPSAVLPSGTYFYRLRAGDYTETKKMIFLK